MGLASNGVCNLGVGSALLGVAEIDPGFIPQNFRVAPAAEGPQVLVSWSNPTNSLAHPFEYQLRRDVFGFPRRLDSGYLVSSGSSSGDVVLSDIIPSASAEGQVYHYSLFIKDPQPEESPVVDAPWFTDVHMQGHAVVRVTGYWKDKLFNLLPSLYRSIDLRPDLGGTGLKKLSQTTGTASTGRLGEVFNASEDSSVLQGQLQRFLKIVGLSLDEIRGLIDHHPKNLLPEHVDPHLMLYLAKNFAWESVSGIPTENRRSELLNAVSFHKRKITGAAAEGMIERGTNTLSASSSEVRDSVFLTTKAPKEFGSHIIGRDLVGFPSSDILMVTGRPDAAASATVTIVDADGVFDLVGGLTSTITIVTTDKTAITATAHASVTTTTDTNSPTFTVVLDDPPMSPLDSPPSSPTYGPEHLIADELATCLNANSKLTATSAVGSADVVISQVDAGVAGNTPIVIFDTADVGITATAFSGGSDIQVDNPASLTNRPRGLLIDSGANSYETGFYLFPFGGDTPDSRLKMIDPGEFTVEFWLRVVRWPTLGASVDLVPSSDQVASQDVMGVTYSDLSRSLVRVALRTIRSTSTGAEIHQLAVLTGAYDSEDYVFSLNEAGGHLKEGEDVHVAVSRKVDDGSPVASGTVTITSFGNVLDESPASITLVATDGTVITATGDDSTTTTTDTNFPTFDVAGNNDDTATNLATCLNANSRLSASAVGAVVTITQAVAGLSGATAISISDPVSPGLSKTDFAFPTEGNTTTWSLYLNGAQVGDSVAKPSGDWFDNTAGLGGSSVVLGSPDLDGIRIGGTGNAGAGFVIDEFRCWRVARSSADISGFYNTYLNSHYPNLVVHSRMDRSDRLAGGSAAGLPAILDTSSVASDGVFHVTTESPSVGHYPSYVSPAAPNPFSRDDLDDGLRRRSRQRGMREGFVASRRFHLRRVRMLVFPGRRKVSV